MRDIAFKTMANSFRHKPVVSFDRISGQTVTQLFKFLLIIVVSVDCRSYDVTCNKPETKDDKAIVEANNFSVGAKASYSCIQGMELIGEKLRTCDSSGHWTGDIPYCRLVDCGRPQVLPYGRGYLLNGTTSFGSVVEYHCLPDFKMVGGSQQRKCLANGNWSGTIPRCLEMSTDNNDENPIEGQTEHNHVLNLLRLLQLG